MLLNVRAGTAQSAYLPKAVDQSGMADQGWVFTFAWPTYLLTHRRFEKFDLFASLQDRANGGPEFEFRRVGDKKVTRRSLSL
ncbi:hypothetical protein [Pseudomonas plecoglossicida]|uniref:hypothetical protein n=1 Tax=Pseudomonas plecoglossicida TaxID=70775 RepID=UPI0015E3985F|nr:hypothetical protein [Pseudomonas plecoglossicida]MBA1323325.1 hypothetical protein [Pseudomonas plecoglossicida]